MNFFDFLNLLFTKPDEVWNLEKSQRNKNVYMLNSYMAIKYPIQANILGHRKMNPDVAIRFWVSLAKRYKGYPKWLYQKSQKSQNFDNLELFFNHFEVDSYTRKKLMSRKEVLERDLEAFNKMFEMKKN